MKRKQAELSEKITTWKQETKAGDIPKRNSFGLLTLMVWAEIPA
jgi:hypothetical protein